MSGNSTTARAGRQTRSKKPAKPYSEYPLFPHASGRWAKKINGKLRYFGRWATQHKRKLVRVEADGWRQALDEYKRTADDLHAGREPERGDGCELRHVLNSFLSNKQDKMDNGELSPQTFADYMVTSDKLVQHFGRSRYADKLIGNLISARSFTGKVTQKAGPRAAMAALGPAFRRVLELVTGDEVHRQSSVARITQDQRETCQQMTPSAVFCAERSPDETTMVFRSWLGTCPCPTHGHMCCFMSPTFKIGDNGAPIRKGPPPYVCQRRQWPRTAPTSASSDGDDVRRLAAILPVCRKKPLFSGLCRSPTVMVFHFES